MDLASPPPRLARRRLLLASGAAAMLATPAIAQTANGRQPVTIIVPFTPGAPPDIVARVLAEGLQKRLGQPVVVDNRPGASGNIGAGLVARAAPDGHTLMVHTTTLVMNAGLYASLPYDPLASFAPIAMLTEVDYALVLHPSGGADLAEFITRARARPEALNYASPGIGTPHHLLMELFQRQAGLRLLHVPYRGTAGAVTGVTAGEVQAMFMPVSGAAELTRGGPLLAAAVTAPARLALLPEALTLAESGVEGVTVRDWFGLLAPSRVSPAALEGLNEAVNAVLAAPETVQALESQGYNVAGGTAEAFRRRMATDMERWGSLVREAGITADGPAPGR
ncbi:Bug family tripartite tricarboxylate transporter substrate binding protein [Roseomonas populi]|uniref:Tripartite tricarboxylate transporter substrate binding protein n=1 Tax=Roseomonas populi TaxID=3121582 RepID=A0ABT1X5E8_9PROT|nr:tripartite tricarboxylate transporter substrate binding protein [Roseomonas pecuniae]MCR0982996.1 tripartite tricarboxylate transporter substrate binding protein [Roseomonas pecuniae]